MAYRMKNIKVYKKEAYKMKSGRPNTIKFKKKSYKIVKSELS